MANKAILFIETDQEQFYFPFEVDIHDLAGFIDSWLLGIADEDFNHVRVPSPMGLIPLYFDRINSAMITDAPLDIFDNPIAHIEDLRGMYGESNNEQEGPGEPNSTT